MQRHGHSAASSASQLRDMFTPGKDKVPQDLKHALGLLQLRDLDKFEASFLALEAFLRPWSEFRDDFFLLQPDGMPRASLPGRVKPMDILWFYTNYDEGFKRYDLRADPRDKNYIDDKNRHGYIDKSEWGVEEHEKLLYVWLLQEFKVGKGRNPHGLVYFNHKNVITVWQQVFVPIVNAVRASYDVKGRRYYGRLATFIEARYPSRLAFPEGNMMSPPAGPTESMLIQITPRPKQGYTVGVRRTPPEDQEGVLGKNQYDEVESELRNAFPGFGGLVERPRFKVMLNTWLSQQKKRAARKQALVQLERESSSNYFTHGHATGNGSDTDSPRRSASLMVPRRSMNESISSGRCSDSTAGRSDMPSTPKIPKSPQVPYGMYGYMPKPKDPKPKSPFHGVTRDFLIPRTPPPPPPPMPRSPTQKVTPNPKARCGLLESAGPDFFAQAQDPTFGYPIQRPSHERKDSEFSVYTSIRNSNPFTEDAPSMFGTLPKLGECQRKESEDAERSPMYPLSAIPKPLFNPANMGDNRYLGSMTNESPSTHSRNKSGTRPASYEGTAYGQGIPPETAYGGHVSATRAYDAVRGGKKPSRLPKPIQPVSYPGHLRAASSQSSKREIPRSVPWPGDESPRKPVPWPGAEVPPIPPMSPARWSSVKGRVTHTPSEQLLRDDSAPNLGPRIVSKENIRATLKHESSEEDLATVQEEDVPRTLSPRLQTFNKHMFPRQDRKGTPVGGWMYKGRDRRSDNYEMELPEGKMNEE